MAYEVLKKERAIPVSGREPVREAAPALRAVPGTGPAGAGMGAQLDEQMQAKMQRFMDKQIPVAEREADELAAGVTARTPQEVKAQLGARMGADFSQVRFHTGADAAGKAESMGARAYATGRDVYFGEGGFDPAVAAHELVHTAQQGAVDSGAQTVSAPMGGVQMMPKWLKSIGRFFSGKKAAPAPAPAPAPTPAPTINPGPNTPQETADFNLLETQLRQEYGSGDAVPEGSARHRYGTTLAAHNRNNARFSAYTQSTNRIRQGAAMQAAMGQFSASLGGQYGSKSGKKKLAKISGMHSTTLRKDRTAQKGIHKMSEDMMGQMSSMMDNPEMQRYLLGHAKAFRGATKGKQGGQDFFADDHMLASTLLNNMNLYLMSPTITAKQMDIARDAGLPLDKASGVTKLAQGSIRDFNTINSAHAGMGTGDLTPQQLAEMTKKLRAGTSNAIPEAEAIQNLKFLPGNRDRTDFSQKEIEKMRKSLYKDRKAGSINKDTVEQYHALYQKMRALIAQNR